MRTRSGIESAGDDVGSRLALIFSSSARSARSIFPPLHVSGPRRLSLRPLVSSLLSPTITQSTGARGRLCHVEAK